MKWWRLIFILAFTIAILIPPTTSTLQAQQDKPLVVLYVKGLEDVKVLEAIVNSIKNVKWKVLTGNLTYRNITDAKMLIVSIAKPGEKLTLVEINGISRWFKVGGKTLWVLGDSDHDSNGVLAIESINELMKSIGSVLRLENCEVIDSTFNVGVENGIFAKVDPDKPITFLKLGIDNDILAYRSSTIIAFTNGKWVNLESGPLKGRYVYRMVWSRSTCKVVDNITPKPEVHKVNTTEKFVLTAVEMFPTFNGLLILSSMRLLGDNYTLWSNRVGNHTFSGLEFIRNVVLWGVSSDNIRIYTLPTITETTTTTTVRYVTKVRTVAADMTMYYSTLAFLVIIIVVLAYIAYGLRKPS